MWNRAFIFFLLTIAPLFVGLRVNAQSNSASELPRGVVIEKVACQDDASQSYSLYLPANYTPEKQWPVLYIFDPNGQGKVPVEIFHDAAEKFGVIVVGSNNSQNNLDGEKLSEIINAFWKDSHARFNIDEKRVYAAGLSGGARVANYFASSCNGCVSGVIASGATFIPKFPLDKRLPFPIFFTVGVDDLNFPELIRTYKTLRENGTTNYLAVFAGRHQWLTKDLTFDAFEWLNLQAMKARALRTDKAFADGLLLKQMDKAGTFFQNGDYLEAARVYEAIIISFKDISDTRQAAEKLSEIRSQKSYKQALADEERSFDEQVKTAKKIFSMAADLVGQPINNMALQRVSAEIESWRQKAKAAVDSSERRLARRILGQVYVEAYEAALYVNRKQKDYQVMIANLELTRLINPQSPSTLLELARAFALGKRKKEALDTLEQAIKNGFSDCDELTGKPEWESMRDDKQFRKAIEQLNCKSKET